MPKRFPFKKPTGPPPTIVLHTEPEEEILLLGLMLEDLELADDMVRRLAFDRDDYTGTIRVALGASKRFAGRCDKLIASREKEAPPAPPERDTPTKGRQRDRGIPRKGTRAAPPTPASSSSGSVNDRILAALKKKPLSSAELAEALGLEHKQVYGPCSFLKKGGAIESRDDDGTRRWFLA